MASMWQKTLFYLGLVDDEESDGEDLGAETEQAVRPIQASPQTQNSGTRQLRARPPGTVAGRRVEPPSSSRRRMSSMPEHAEAGLYVQDAGGTYTRSPAESEIVVARNFSDAQMLADSIRTGRAVVLDLRSTEPEMVRRLVDFTSGLIYALDGKMAKINQGVILVTPPGVSISLGEQDRLGSLGLLQRSDG
jgi:cell division inhibitor SepF